jgi:hypothetical protein
MTKILSSAQIFMGASVLALALALVSPAIAGAATYAYVDAGGEVKSVVATDWRTAIATAPNIHIHSGVLLLDEPTDFKIIGTDVPVA